MLCEQIEAFLLFISLNFYKILESGCKPREKCRVEPCSVPACLCLTARRRAAAPCVQAAHLAAARLLGQPIVHLGAAVQPGRHGGRHGERHGCTRRPGAWGRGRVAPPAGRGGAARAARAALPSKAEHDKPLRNAALFSPATRRFDNTTGCCWSVPAGNGVNRAVLVRAGLCARHGILVHFKRRVRPGDHGTPNMRCWQRCPPKPRFPKFFPSCPPLLFARS